MSYNPIVRDYVKCVESGLQPKVDLSININKKYPPSPEHLLNNKKYDGEVKTDLIKLVDGQSYLSEDGNSYVISDDHTLSDIVRWLLTQASKSEIISLIEEE